MARGKERGSPRIKSMNKAIEKRSAVKIDKERAEVQKKTVKNRSKGYKKR